MRRQQHPLLLLAERKWHSANMPEILPRPESDTAPCIGCGLCCDGTLYMEAKVGDGERESLIGRGMSLITDGGAEYFTLPCRHFCGGCTIYAERFQRCRSFRCALLRRYQAGEISLADARSKIEQALTIRAAIIAEDESARLFVNRRRLSAELAERNDPNRARLRLNMIALDELLNRFFRNKKIPTTEAPPAVQD